MSMFQVGYLRVLLFALAFACVAPIAMARGQECPASVNPISSMPLSPATSQSNCAIRMSMGFPIPDPTCTPGATNPTVTIDVLRSGDFKTGCERDTASSADEKATTYHAYNIDHPADNRGQNQTCELDHLISLEIGGADTLDNIWPQCGPDGAQLNERYFKIKDSVENYLAAEVKAGDISLTCAQQGIATNWPQYISVAQTFFSDGTETKYDAGCRTLPAS